MASIEAVLLPEQFDQQVQSWDCAFKDLNTSDFVAGQVWAAVGADRFGLHQVKKRMDLPTTIAAFRQMSVASPACQNPALWCSRFNDLAQYYG